MPATGGQIAATDIVCYIAIYFSFRHSGPNVVVVVACVRRRRRGSRRRVAGYFDHPTGSHRGTARRTPPLSAELRDRLRGVSRVSRAKRSVPRPLPSAARPRACPIRAANFLFSFLFLVRRIFSSPLSSVRPCPSVRPSVVRSISSRRRSRPVTLFLREFFFFFF